MTTSELLKELWAKARNGEIERPIELYEMYKTANDSRARKAISQYSVGDRVRFNGRKTGRHAGVFEGVVRQVNQKTLKVKTDTQNGRPLSFPQVWNVSASSVTPAGNGLQQLTNLVDTNNDTQDKGLNCPYCGKKCSSTSGLTLHKKSCKKKVQI